MSSMAQMLHEAAQKCKDAPLKELLLQASACVKNMRLTHERAQDNLKTELASAEQLIASLRKLLTRSERELYEARQENQRIRGVNEVLARNYMAVCDEAEL